MPKKRSSSEEVKTTKPKATRPKATKPKATKPKATKPKATKPKATKASFFPVVGMGASAGGLEALEKFFKEMPSDANISFVVIQHLAPKYKSIMGSLLEKGTAMKVLEITDGVAIEPNTIYLNPPDRDVQMINGALHLSAPLKTAGVRLPIDFFFRSLAEDQGENAICIIISGTGTDGTLGLKAIKGEGGIAFVQEESQARYDGMPRSAIDTGLVDYILPVEQMPEELLKYVKHPYIKGPAKVVTPEEKFSNIMHKVFLIIRSATGHDFSNYKQNTIRRRIERRMAVHQIETIDTYLTYLRQNPVEVETLYKDLLIGVTNFFRDPDAFETLDKEVIRKILKAKDVESSIRVWVPGCSTGEEAYSIAILFVEAMEKIKKHVDVQVFATDIDAEAIEYARIGTYPDAIAADVSNMRLDRFFVKDNNTYKVKKQIREMVVFAVQNLIKDPPFSKLDLVSCRNVLIYMDSVLQKKIIPLFQYILNQDGFLFLGTSESIGDYADLFSVIESKWKIFRRKVSVIERNELHRLPMMGTISEEQQSVDTKVISTASIRELAEKLILESYSPACVLVDSQYDIVYFHGDTSAYLSPPKGEPSFNILKMAHSELSYKLSIAIHKSLKQKKQVKVEGFQVRVNGSFKSINLIIRPIQETKTMQGLIMVIFEEVRHEEAESKVLVKEGKTKKKEDPRVPALEQELQSTKEYLQTTIEELETSNEELKSTNEELQSTNEEMQSTNEELETSKEELQSTNEELETVNSELQNKVNELSRANDDLNNLLGSTEIGTIFLDTNLCIKRFTTPAAKIFNLIQTDIGRPISDITSNIKYDRLYHDAEEVLGTLAKKENEVTGIEGRVYLMRIMPYRTLDNVIDGVVITFVDNTEIIEAEDRATERIKSLQKEIAALKGKTDS